VPVVPKDDNKPGLVARLWKRLRSWLDQRQPTLFDSIIAGVLAALLTGAGLTAVVSYVFNLLLPGGEVPGYSLAVAGGIFLTLGLIGAWLATRAIYEAQFRTKQTELDAVRESGQQALDSAQSEYDIKLEALRNEHELLARALKAELDLEREKLLGIEPDRQALVRQGIYFEHVYDLVDGLIRGQLSFEDLSGEVVGRSICGVTQEYLTSAAGHEFRVSIWAEPSTSRVRDQLQKLPGTAWLHKFEVVAATPEHTLDETKSFAVPIELSWLKHNYLQEHAKPKRRVYVADSLDLVGLTGPDLEAFLAHDYQSVRATSFHRDGMIGYIVVLSKAPQAFTAVENRYLLWLRHVLEIDQVMRSGSPVPRPML
jgi:hypothetical protein